MKHHKIIAAAALVTSIAVAQHFTSGGSSDLGRRASTSWGREEGYALPDHSVTPGAVLSTDLAAICRPGYSKSVRNVPTSLKRKAESEYGLSSNPGEIDHLISLELGGSNDITNLWPQPSPDFRIKDKLENLEHKLICGGSRDLSTIQHDIATDWVQLARDEGVL